MKIFKITLPVKEWEDCVLAYREKEKRKWQCKLEAQRTGNNT
ncbi:hypothetical protein [Brevibacillus agri]|nr:hypothetical protein [Brevibacillus agri]